jgi:hypothetical protein
MSNILDDLFQWAANQPPENFVSVDIAITSNELTRKNLVSYAAGPLTYNPSKHVGFFWIPANFASEKNNSLKQYFSDRGGSPFNPDDTDPLDVTIEAPNIGLSQYIITLHSPKWNFQYQIKPGFDVATQVIIGTSGPSLLTFSLCGQLSQSPPR